MVHRVFCPLNRVAVGASDHEIRGIIGPTESEWHYVVHGVIPAHLLTAVETIALLTSVLSLYVFGSIGAIGPLLHVAALACRETETEIKKAPGEDASLYAM